MLKNFHLIAFFISILIISIKCSLETCLADCTSRMMSCMQSCSYVPITTTNELPKSTRIITTTLDTTTITMEALETENIETELETTASPVMSGLVTTITTSSTGKPMMSMIALTVLNNGNLIGLGSDYSTIKIWNATSGGIVKRIKNAFTTQTGAIAILKNGVYLACGNYLGQYGGISIINTVNGELVKLANNTENNGPIESFAILQNGDLVAGYYDGTIKVWNSTSLTLKLTLSHANSTYVLSLVVMPNGYLAAGYNGLFSNTTFIIWDINTGKAKVKVSKAKLGGGCDKLAVLQNGYLACTTFAGANIINVLNPANGAVVTIKPFFQVNSMLALPNGELAVGTAPGIVVLNSINFQTVTTFHSNPNSTITLALLPNGNLAASEYNGLIEIWKYYSLEI